MQNRYFCNKICLKFDYFDIKKRKGNPFVFVLSSLNFSTRNHDKCNNCKHDNR